MSAENQRLVGSAVEKLKFIDSPLHKEPKPARTESSLHSSTFTVVERKDTTQSRRLEEIRLAHNDDATNLEIFYDLFLACINLFSQNQQLSTLKGLSAYCGFFGIIWTTWFMTGMYDVRFLKDSIFERCARGVHLGVLVGFVVVSPNFDPSDQDPVVFKVFTIILMASRVCLAVEYGALFWHLRHFPGARVPIGSLVVKNSIAAIIYLAVAFRFREGHDSNIFSVWYILAGFEIIGAVWLSYRYKFLSFQGTYIMKRMGLLTCIFFGEGVASACGSITKVIKAEDHLDVWTNQTIGVVTACIALVYIVYMVYSDWVSKVQLPGWRQMAWVLIHFPLHLAMMLFMEGVSNFIIFWKLTEQSLRTGRMLEPLVENMASETFAEDLTQFVTDFTNKFPPMYTFLYTALSDALETIGSIDVQGMIDRLRAAGASEQDVLKDKEYSTLVKATTDIGLALDNILYGTYGIDFTKEVVEDSGISDEDEVVGLQQTINQRNYARFRVVFQYTFVCAGFFLALANVLSIISRTKKWTWSASMYHTAIFILAIGMSLVAAVSQNDVYLMDYQSTPWVLPTLLLSYMLILTMNHVSGWLAAKRDKKATQAAAMENQYPSGSSGSFEGQGQQQYGGVIENKGPVYQYVPEENLRMSYPYQPQDGVFSVPRRPVGYQPANYEPGNAV